MESPVMLFGWFFAPVPTHFNVDCTNRVYRVCIEARMRRDDLPPGERMGQHSLKGHLVLRKTSLYQYCCHKYI